MHDDLGLISKRMAIEPESTGDNLMVQDRGAESSLPSKLSNPARRALEAAGISRLEQLSRLTEAEVLNLHGMGPKGIDVLRRSLAENGLSFKRPA